MSNTWWVLGAIALGACSGAPTGNQAPPLEVVVRTDPAAAADCPYGGSVVRSGLDDNRNGKLDDVEVLTSTVVCNDPPIKPPPAIVVRLVAEPAGGHCALGGAAVQSGPDRNGNGRLDDDEVEHIDYACGSVLLTRLATEPPGSRCVAGGVAFLVGRDRNRDGQLGDDEVEQTELQCGSELSRDVAVRTASDMAALANIAIITGSLVVDGSALAELALPRLVQVRGALEIAGDDALVRIAMPALQSVDGRVTLAHDRKLATIELPQLRRAGSLTIEGNPVLADLRGLPALTRVVGDVHISGNDALVSAALPIIRIDGDLLIDGNAQLAQLSWTGAEQLSSVHIMANPRLQIVALPREQSSFNALGDVTISANDQLDHISIAASEIASIAIEDNPTLASVVVFTDTARGDMVVRGNGRLQLTSQDDPRFGVVIGGSLVLSGPVATFNRGGLWQVAGDVTIDATELPSDAKPMLVGGSLHLTNNPLLTAPALSAAGGSVEVRNNARLATLSFLVQTQIDGNLIVADNAVLEAAASLEALVRIHGDVSISSNPVLKSVFGPSLEQVDGNLSFDHNDNLNDLGLARLARVGSLAVTRCSSLPELDLLALSDVTTRIDVRGNAALGHVKLPVLRRADIGVFDNPHLPACELEALFAVLFGDHHQSGNDDTAVCP